MAQTNVDTSISTLKFKLDTAKRFVDAMKLSTNNLYMFAGKPDPWLPDDEDPPEANNTVQSVSYDYWRNMFFCKKISALDIKLMIDRYNWTTGTKYTAYDDKVDLSDTSFYVLTDDNNVYKCLFNNGGIASTTKPEGHVTGTTTTADGYIWKFMYNLSTESVDEFLVTTHVPVEVLSSDDGSFQWDTQAAAVNTGIEIINVEDGGSGYDLHTGNAGSSSTISIVYLDTGTEIDLSDSDNRYVGSVLHITSGTAEGDAREITAYNGTTKVATVNGDFSIALEACSTYSIAPKVSIGGEGTGCIAVSQMTSNSISTIDVLEEGSGYRNAYGDWDATNSEYSSIVTISANGGSTANATAIISPEGGHGSNAYAELLAYNTLVKAKFSGSETDTLTITNDYRQFGLILNPIASANDTVYEEDTAKQYTSIAFDTLAGTFILDSNVSGLTSEATGRVLDVNSSVLNLYSTTGTFEADETIRQEAGITCNVVSVTEPVLVPYTGEMLVIASREEISRATDQAEAFHYIFNF